MVGDFMVCVDRIIASACFDPHNGLAVAAAPAALVKNGPAGLEEGSSENKKGGPVKKKKKGGGEVIECRICQEEGEEGDMESPCACNGTLKVCPFFPVSSLIFLLLMGIVCFCGDFLGLEMVCVLKF